MRFEQSNTALIVFDHKKKVLPLYYKEGQSQYFGKRGFSLLGLMVCFRQQTRFYDIDIKCHAVQDALQIQGILTLVQPIVHSDLPLVVNIVLQSDNAPCYSASDNIRFVYQMNCRYQNYPQIIRWINTEAQKGKPCSIATLLMLEHSFENLF